MKFEFLLLKEENLERGGFLSKRVKLPDSNKLSWVDRIGYGSGDMAQNLIYQTISVWLLFFYTNIFGLDPAAAATMFLVVRFVDVVWDPIVGTFIDKLNPRWGKYRAYLIIGGIPLTVFAILCFWNGFSGSLAYAYFTYIAMSMCYTWVNVPYCALNAALTRDPKEVTILTSTRMFMANLGGFAVTAGIPIVIEIFAPKDPITGAAIIGTTESADAWFITMCIYSIIGFVLLCICFATTKERIVMNREESSKVKISDLWMELVRNRPLRILALFFFVGFGIYSISNAAGSYYMTYNIQASAEEISLYMALGFIPAMITIPLLPMIKNHLGTKRVFYVFLILAIIGLAILYLASSIDFLRGQIWLVFVGQLIKSAGITTIIIGFMWSLVPDVVSFGEYRSGRRIAGMANAITGIFFKAGAALGGAVPGYVLSFVGFNAEIQVQTPFAEQGILWLISVIPFILIVIAMIIISRYELTDEKMYEINKAIETKKNG